MKWKEGTTRTMNAKRKSDAGGYEKVKEKRMIKKERGREVGKRRSLWSSAALYMFLAALQVSPLSLAPLSLSLNE